MDWKCNELASSQTKTDSCFFRAKDLMTRRTAYTVMIIASLTLADYQCTRVRYAPPGNITWQTRGMQSG